MENSARKTAVSWSVLPTSPPRSPPGPGGSGLFGEHSAEPGNKVPSFGFGTMHHWKQKLSTLLLKSRELYRLYNSLLNSEGITYWSLVRRGERSNRKPPQWQEQGFEDGNQGVVLYYSLMEPVLVRQTKKSRPVVSALRR